MISNSIYLPGIAILTMQHAQWRRLGLITGYTAVVLGERYQQAVPLDSTRESQL